MIGQISIVTGAGRGIGRATAIALARQGSQVVLAARTSAELQATARQIQEQGGVAEPVVSDIGREADVDELFERCLARFGPVTLLVNNAGTLTRSLFPEITAEEFDDTLASNVRGAFLCARAAFRQMAPTGGGCIVNIASLSGTAGVEKFPGLAAYVVAKFGIVGLTEALAIEGQPFNIRVVALSPGAVDTNLLARAVPGLKPGMTPEQAARLILFLASDSAAAVNGLNIPIFSNA
jgi:NAD(P)-dependent dehydrogenase (short-subunit alcohol dehydrogenase family)